jgi:UDP-2-acetamido-2,6-beta-L-arabino-hexul-4-ose reductase
MIIGITGGEGFIGSHFSKKLSDPILFKGDLHDLESVKEFVRRCDRIYHFAGLNRENEGMILRNNLLATGNILLASKLLSKEPEIIFSSSMQVEWNPNSEYGLTKSLEEEIIKKAKHWCIFRIPNVYGPGGRPFYNSVIATFTYQISKNEELTVNDPSEHREFIYIDDLTDALLKPKFNHHIHLGGEVLTIGQIKQYLTVDLGKHDKLKRCLDYYSRN